MKSQARPAQGRPAPKRIFVGLSGGVDSSVSAALLQKAGYDVTGVFIKTWTPEWLPCTWREERRDAMRVAAHLGIPFKTLDLEKEYKRDVADYMIAEYKAGHTPNPDVMCNTHIKFGAFYDWAMENGADYVATGHYSRVQSATCEGQSEVRLMAGVDENKDQSYFLWNVRVEQLSHIMFPVGGLTKPEVRKLATRFELPTSDKKDSQGICFLGMVDMKEFLSHYIKSKTGDVLDTKGKKIGTHPGALFLTLGERHGFTITEKTPHDDPYYVVGKNIEKNTITVEQGKNISRDKAHTQITIHDTNWLSTPRAGQKYHARSRYRQKLHPVVLVSLTNDVAVIEYGDSPDIPTPGQSLVIYDEDVVVGGGIIA